MRRHLLWLFAIGLLLAPAAARAQTEEVIYYHTDAIGSVRATSDATGAVIARYDYLPFGELCEAACGGTPPANAREYAGKERDAETELDYFGARYFRASSGRFVTVDPVVNAEAALTNPQRWNRYTYAVNNPLKFTDPDGRDPQIIGAVIGAAVYAGWNAYVNVRQGRPWYTNMGVETSKGIILGLTLGLAAPALVASDSALMAGSAVEESGILASVAKGKSGEVLADIVKNTQRIPSATGTAAYRVPDILDHANKIIGDVKNFSNTLSMSNQLRDFIAYARDRGYSIVLRVPDPSKVSQSLRTEIEELGGSIERIRR